MLIYSGSSDLGAFNHFLGRFACFRLLNRVRSKYGIPRQPWILDSTPWITDSNYWIRNLFQWNLDSGFQSLMAFRIPRPRIPDSTSKYFQDSGIRIPLRGATECKKRFNLVPRVLSGERTWERGWKRFTDRERTYSRLGKRLL